MARHYRYRTSALFGAWRATPEKAVEDAIKVKQAARDAESPGGVRWAVPGRIEEAEIDQDIETDQG